MLCSHCGQTSKGVVCIPCRTQRTRAGMLLHQRRFLETWLTGGIQLRVTRRDGVPHLQLFDDRWHTYCDIELHAVPPVTERHQEVPEGMCPECLVVFDRLINEARERLEPKQSLTGNLPLIK
jgi:hypothetical protein